MSTLNSQAIRTARLPWWLVLIPGAAGVLLALLLLGSPDRGLTGVAQILGLYWFIFGALAAFSLARQPGQMLWKMVSGGLSLLAGVLAALNMLAGGFLTEPVLVVLIGLAGALIGLLGLVQALRGEGIVSGVLGGMNLLLGLLLLFQPQVGAWPLAWLLGSLLLFGSLLAIFAALTRSILGASYPSASRQVAYSAAPDIQEAAAPSAAGEIADLELEAAAAPAAWELPLRYEPPAPPLDEDVDAIAKAEEEEKSSLWSSPETEKAIERMQYEEHTAIPLGTPPSGEDIGELEDETLGLAAASAAELEVTPEIELPFEGAGADAEFEAPPEPPLRAASVLESLPSLDVNADAELEAPPELEDAAPAPQVEELPPAPEVTAIQPEPPAAPAAASEEEAAQAELMTKFRFPLEFVEGIGPAYAAALKNAGLHTCLDLLKAGTTRSGREHISQKSGLPGALIMKWVNHVDLYRVRGVGSEYADLLEAAGVDTVAELAQRSPSHLYAALIEVYNEKQPVRQMPTQAQVEDWVRRAKRLPRAVEY